MRFLLPLSILAAGGALPAAALTLDLPVRVPGEAAVTRAPAYRGDLIELRLAPGPARVARARAAGRLRAESLGIAALDRLAARLGGVWFEPGFRGETAPPEGSPEPDLTAFYLAHLPRGVALGEALAAFRALGEVESAGPIAILPVSLVPNDSLWSRSYWFYQPGTGRDLAAREAWDLTTGDTSIVVAILDTGVLPWHPDLGGRVAGLPGQMWTNWSEAGGLPGVDDDGNGFVDDLHGWDFVHLGTSPDVEPGEDGVNEDNDPNDFVGHGTAVAGVVGALTDNGIGIAGTAWRVRLMPLRMGWAFRGARPGEGEVDMSFAARAIRYATRMGASVINCSWASAPLALLDAAVTAAVRAGVTVVSAAGNNNPFRYLAERDDVLAIAATDAGDVIAPFSNRGAFVDLAAPGVNLSSTWLVQIAGADSLGRRLPAYRVDLNGTSFSAPLAAGAVALLHARSVGTFAPRRLTPRGVQLRLMETADDISAQNPGLAGQYGAGRLNAHRALGETGGSSATHVGSPTVGAAVLLPSNVRPRVAFLATNGALVQIDGATQDTLALEIAPSLPNGHLAAAEVDGFAGPALFFATREAGVFGYTAGLWPLPGWPQPGSAPFAMYGPALGDLDGDGAIEVVSGGHDGRLWAWHADGTLVAGFPVTVTGAPLSAPPALSDLDGLPGAEVLVAARSDSVYAFRHDGGLLPGWPQSVGPSPRAPVVTRLGSASEPSVIVAGGDQLHAFSPDGRPRPGFPVTLEGIPAQDPALGDLDGDGFDEIVVVTEMPAGIEVRDSSGVSLTALNWRRPLAGRPQGPPVLGELSTRSPGPELLLMRGGSLLALERDGDSLASFPKAGGAGLVPTLAQADQDPAVEVLAGTAFDLQYYIYDAGPGSEAEGPAPWPTARGNFARTGSRLYAPPLGTVDDQAPAPVADLRVVAFSDSAVSLEWTATGDDGTNGRPRLYAVRAALQPLDEASFVDAPLRREVAATVDAGGREHSVFPGLSPVTRYWFALKAVDKSNNLSVLSNVVEGWTEVGGPLRGRTGVALAVGRQPARKTVEFFWQASADGEGGPQRIEIFDAAGRRLRVLGVGPAAGGRLTWDGRDAEGRSVPAGLYFARLISGSLHARTRVVLLP